jgi:ABC-type transport system involved in multi-copper enzyme maturation permease subunit
MNLLTLIDFRKLVDATWIFEKTPSSHGMYLYLAIVFGFCVIAAIVIGLMYAKQNKTFRKVYSMVYNMLLTVGLIGLFLVLMRYQSISYMGSRFLLYVLFLVVLMWVNQILVYRYLELPKEIKKKQEREKFEKYLPKAKKKSNFQDKIIY